MNMHSFPSFLVPYPLVALLWLSPLFAVDPVNTSFTGLAIKGYDPVAYFLLKTPVKGSKQYAYEWRGATWLFANPNHLKMFQNFPENYAPQYGGYCAWAVSQNDTANIDPKAWRIVNGKLYLNYNADIQRKWEADQVWFIELADQHWPHLLKK